MDSINSKTSQTPNKVSHRHPRPFFNAGGAGAFFQPKLTINEPGDQYEQEADAMADRVMRFAEVDSNGKSISLQRMPITAVQRKCKGCEQEELHRMESPEEEEPAMEDSNTLMRKAVGGGYQAASQLSNNLSRSKVSGSPMSKNTQHFMESSFGTDFSGVRVHTDHRAVNMNRGIQAKAFTHGRDIYFNRGQYAPESASGKRLLAHELTHVVQQKGNKRTIQRAPIRIGNRMFMEGEITMNALARRDILRNRNLLPGPDQAHIAGTRNGKLAYEISHTSPDDPFRWNMLKNMIDNEHIEIRGISNTTNYTVHEARVTAGGITVTPRQVNLASLALATGHALPTLALQRRIHPSRRIYVASTSTVAHQVYYESGRGGRGMFGGNSLAHELFGHIGLALEGVPFGHGGSLAGTTGIQDPLGRRFTGSVNDYISQFAGASHLTQMESPTQHVSPQFLQSSSQWIIQNGASHIDATGLGSIDADFDRQWQFLSNNYDILRLSTVPVTVGPNTTITRASLLTQLITWASSLPSAKLTAFKNVLRSITTRFGGGRRSRLSSDLLPRI